MGMSDFELPTIKEARDEKGSTVSSMLASVDGKMRLTMTKIAADGSEKNNETGSTVMKNTFDRQGTASF